MQKNNTKTRTSRKTRKGAQDFAVLFERASRRACHPEFIETLWPLLVALSEQLPAHRMAALISQGSMAAYYAYNEKLEAARAIVTAGAVHPELEAAMRPLLRDMAAQPSSLD